MCKIWVNNVLPKLGETAMLMVLPPTHFTFVAYADFFSYSHSLEGIDFTNWFCSEIWPKSLFQMTFENLPLREESQTMFHAP